MGNKKKRFIFKGQVFIPLPLTVTNTTYMKEENVHEECLDEIKQLEEENAGLMEEIDSLTEIINEVKALVS